LERSAPSLPGESVGDQCAIFDHCGENWKRISGGFKNRAQGKFAAGQRKAQLDQRGPAGLLLLDPDLFLRIVETPFNTIHFRQQVEPETSLPVRLQKLISLAGTDRTFRKWFAVCICAVKNREPSWRGKIVPSPARFCRAYLRARAAASVLPAMAMAQE
jgi:hypothetical protein